MAGPRRGKRGEGARKGARILIVEARYYDEIADALLAGAMKALQEAGAEVDRRGIGHRPGSWGRGARRRLRRRIRCRDGVVLPRGEFVMGLGRQFFDGFFICSRDRSGVSSDLAVVRRRQSGKERQRVAG